MEIFIAIIQILAGTVLLYFGADYLVRGAVMLSKKAGLSSLVIGLTVVAFGTSMPEMVISLNAAVNDKPDISLGNIVGSNICNIGLIMGLSALIRPLTGDRSLLKLDIPFLCVISLLLAGVCIFTGGIERIIGILFLLLLALYLFYCIKNGKNDPEDLPDEVKEEAKGIVAKHLLLFAILFVGCGLGALVFGADLFVKGAVTTARMLHVSEAVIGLTLIALGTSLPELATSLVAAIKGESGIAAGNVIGSNIFNILAIMGVTPLVMPVHAQGIDGLDLGIMLAFTFALIPILLIGPRIGRIKGGVLLLGYIAYMIYLGTGH